MRSLALSRLALLVAAFLALYGVLLFAGLRHGVAIAAERGIARVAIAAMAIASPVPVERRVSLEQQGGRVAYTLRVAMGANVVEGTFTHNFHAQNLLLFLVLALATPGLALRQRALALGVGLGVIAAIDVLITMGDLWVAEEVGLKINTRIGANRGVSEVGLLMRFLHPTGGVFMAPVFVWALLILGPLRGGVMRALQRSGPEPSRERAR